MLTENLLLAAGGGLLGAWLANGLVVWLKQVLPGFVPIADSAALVELPPIVLDGWAFAFGAALAVVTVLLFGLFPAWRATAGRVHDALKATAAGTTGDRRQQRARHWFVACETALATVLLIVAGLLLRTVFNLVRSEPGFRAEQVLTLNFGRLHELDVAARARYYDAVVNNVAAVPGVQAVGLNDYVLLQNEDDYEGFHLTNRPKPQPGTSPREEWRRISPDYFRALGVPLIEGRFFNTTDNAAAPSVVLINQALARKYWPNEDPVGQRINPHHKAYGESEIVGIVGDVREVGLDKPAKPMLFVPYQRAPRPLMALFVKTAAPPERLLTAIQDAVWAADATQPIFNVNGLERIVADSIAVQRLLLWVSAALAVLAVLLTALDIYGVVSYALAQRTREIGLRVALGAQRRDIFWLVVKQGLQSPVWGVALGSAIALAVTRLLANQIYGVTPADPLTFAGVAALFVVVALLACYLPARRATKVDPLIALRCE